MSRVPVSLRLPGRIALLASAAFAHAQSADTILLNGKIVHYDAAPAQALAVRDGKIAAVGRSADIRALAGPATRVDRSRRPHRHSRA